MEIITQKGANALNLKVHAHEIILHRVEVRSAYGAEIREMSDAGLRFGLVNWRCSRLQHWPIYKATRSIIQLTIDCMFIRHSGCALLQLSLR